MEFNFDCEEILVCDRNGFSILEGSCHNKIVPGYKAYIKEILDKMGELSSKSQNLLVNVTTTNKFFPSDHCLIIKAEKNKVLGYIKVGPKKLFLRDRICNYHERKTLCVLDFYIYDTEQRSNLGREIFDYMLNYKNIEPGELAYDRPTLRFLSFLKRNYGLENFITQDNNFTIFEEFFESDRIRNNETQYDSDTHRVIENLNRPNYLNRSYNFNANKFISNRNSYNNDNYRASPQNNTINNYKKNYNMTETDDYQRPAMSPIGKQLIYNNDFKKYNINRQESNNRNQKTNQFNDENYDIKYNNRNRQNQLYNKRYNNNDEYLENNKLSEFEYNQITDDQRSRNNFVNRKYPQNQMSKSMNYNNYNYNNQQENYDERNRKKYEYNDFYNGNRYYNTPNYYY